MKTIIYQRPKSKDFGGSGGAGRELSRYYSGKIVDSGWRDKWM
jgi:hypothetical protein